MSLVHLCKLVFELLLLRRSQHTENLLMELLTIRFTLLLRGVLISLFRGFEKAFDLRLLLAGQVELMKRTEERVAAMMPVMVHLTRWSRAGLNRGGSAGLSSRRHR